jgi:teichuronic acid exporter
MSDKLKKKTYKAAFWSAVDAIGTRMVQFMVGIVLARLLLPEQFGLIGMLAIFLGITQALLDSGFGAALIQKKDITVTDSSSVFYFNIIISFCLAMFLFMAAPLISDFYDQPALIALTRALSLVIVINSFSVVQTAMLSRQMNFKIQTKVGLVAGIISGIIGIGMAYAGYGVWSLVAQQVTAAMLRAIMLWLLNSWRPGLVLSIHSLREMFKFGSRLLASGLLDQTFQNIYYVVIGKLFNPALLGFYTRARHMEEMPSTTLSQVITRVSFPAFASIQSDDIRLKRGLKKALSLLIFLNAPVMVGLAVVAEPLVKVLLTERWLPSVPYLQLLCVLGLILPFHTLNLNMLMAKGRSDLFFRLEIIKKCLVIVSIAIFYRWGIIALILGQIVVSVLSIPLNSYYSGKQLHYGALQQIKDVSIYFIFAFVMGVCVFSVGLFDFANELILLFMQVGMGIVVYPLLCAVFRLPAFIELYEVLRQRFNQYPNPASAQR